MTGTVNAARQGSGGRQKRSPYGLVVLACGSTIYPLKPAQAQASRATGRAPTRPNAACCTCVLTARRRSRSRFASATRRPRLPTGIGWSALPRIGSVPPDGSPTAVRQRIRLSAPAERPSTGYFGDDGDRGSIACPEHSSGSATPRPSSRVCGGRGRSRRRWRAAQRLARPAHRDVVDVPRPQARQSVEAHVG